MRRSDNGPLEESARPNSERVLSYLDLKGGYHEKKNCPHRRRQIGQILAMLAARKKWADIVILMFRIPESGQGESFDLMEMAPTEITTQDYWEF